VHWAEDSSDPDIEDWVSILGKIAAVADLGISQQLEVQTLVLYK
jgi:hypothetical protein